MAILTNKNVPIETLFNWIGYWPIDGTVHKDWMQGGLAMSDFPVAYTIYGAEQALMHDTDKLKIKDRLSIIPHGVNTKEFYPLDKKEIKKFRKEFYGGHVKKDTFLIVNVSRNQTRKDLARTIKIYAEYKKINPKAFLYMHANPADVGGDLWHIAEQFGLEPGKDMACPDPKFNEMFGFPLSVVNEIYNSADVLLTTTLGEGWGFINTEAMAVKKPIIAPANTVIPEIFNMQDIYEKEVGIKYLNDNYKTLRGIPIKCGTTSTEWVNMGVIDNGTIRPLTNVVDGVKKLDWVYKNKDKVKTIIENGYKYSQEITWDNVCKQWVELFDIAYQDIVKARKQGHKTNEKGGDKKNDKD